MRLTLLAAVAALFAVSAGISSAAEPPKGPEPKACPVVTCQPCPVTYLGVAAMPAGPALTRQIGLPHGVGLMIEGVVPDSPAGKAGISQYDVLEKLDDQILIDPHQFRTLVWMHKPGDQVKLTFHRGGKAQTASVTLASTDRANEKDAFHRTGAMGIVRPFHTWNRELADLRRKLAETESRIQDSIKREVKAALPAPPGTPQASPSVADTAPEISLGASVNVTVTNEKYTITVNAKSGQEFATITTADGKTLCKDLPKARWAASLPEDVRTILDGIRFNARGAMERIEVEE